MRGIVPEITPFADKSNKQQEERQVPNEYHYVGSMRRTKGHILFAYNTKTKEWSRADIKREVAVGIDGKPIFKTSVSVHEDIIYIQALNISNAKKKLLKLSTN